MILFVENVMELAMPVSIWLRPVVGISILISDGLFFLEGTIK